MGKVVLSDCESEPFSVNVNVKQGCVLAPVIFSLFLVAVTLPCNMKACAVAIGINFRLHGSVFNTAVYQQPLTPPVHLPR